MKIALVCPASLPATQFGGIMFLCVNIAKKLSNDGHSVTIYTSDLDFANNTDTFNRSLPREEKIENFTIKRTHAWFSIFLFFVTPGIFKQMLSDDFDIIHAVGVRGFQALAASIVSKIKKIPLIISDQGGLTTHPDLNNASIFKKFLIKLQNPIIKSIINQATVVVAANDYEKKIFKNFCDESKIKIVKNGIDLDELNTPTINFKEKYNMENDFILFLGRFHKVKGIDTLIDAVDQIKNKLNLSGVKIVIMGADFGYEFEMEQKISKLNLSQNILVIKKPSRNIVISAYSQCNFAVLPSRWELSPLTPLEVFACKKTVISTTAHGIPHTITHEKNCLLVPPSNPQKLATAILELLENPSKCDKLAKTGFDMVSNEANLSSMTNEVFRVYEKTIQVKKNELFENK
ncbi:MAG: glycosyltransferase family 4 protein [Candidatus Nitrosopelagicus sp.]|nr:glycosyltransferase family 4 protein [Candidatus Nitrosopelagicus sp.]